MNFEDQVKAAAEAKGLDWARWGTILLSLLQKLLEELTQPQPVMAKAQSHDDDSCPCPADCCAQIDCTIDHLVCALAHQMNLKRCCKPE